MYRLCVPAVPNAWRKVPLPCFFAARAIPAIPEPVRLRRQREPELPVSCSAGRKMQRQKPHMYHFAASAFLRCRFVRGLGAAKRAAPLDAPYQAAWSSAEVYQLRGWKMVLPEMPALWV